VPYPPRAMPPVVPGEPAPGDEGGEDPGGGEGLPVPPF
jgi:hypothetical protein